MTLLIDITDRAELVYHAKDVWGRLTAEERQEVITSGPVPIRPIIAEWREAEPEPVVPPGPAEMLPARVTGLPVTLLDYSFYEAATGQKPPAAAVRRFTGDVCDNCGSAHMVRTGTCLTCQDCGTPSGGCS